MTQKLWLFQLQYKAFVLERWLFQMNVILWEPWWEKVMFPAISFQALIFHTNNTLHQRLWHLRIHSERFYFFGKNPFATIIPLKLGVFLSLVVTRELCVVVQIVFISLQQMSATTPGWIYQFSSDHWSQAAKGSVSTWMGDRLGIPSVAGLTFSFCTAQNWQIFNILHPSRHGFQIQVDHWMTHVDRALRSPLTSKFGVHNFQLPRLYACEMTRCQDTTDCSSCFNGRQGSCPLFICCSAQQQQLNGTKVRACDRVEDQDCHWGAEWMSATTPGWKYQFTSDHWSQAAMGSVSTWMGDRLGIPSVAGSFFFVSAHLFRASFQDRHTLPTGSVGTWMGDHLAPLDSRSDDTLAASVEDRTTELLSDMTKTRNSLRNIHLCAVGLGLGVMTIILYSSDPSITQILCVCHTSHPHRLS